MSDTVLSLKNIKKNFTQGNMNLQVLKDIDLEIKAGEIVALVGSSGAGKSTLLHIIGLLERPDEGEVILNDISCESADDNTRTMYRREFLGFVYQNHNLLPEFSALENVMIPQMIAGYSTDKIETRARWLIEKMGLLDRLEHRPSELSGGEQQRIAIARALINAPRLLLADEPTGNLDHQTSKVVFSELLKLVKETGLSAIIATHNPELASKMDRKLTLREGKLVEIKSYQNSLKSEKSFVTPDEKPTIINKKSPFSKDKLKEIKK